MEEISMKKIIKVFFIIGIVLIMILGVRYIMDDNRPTKVEKNLTVKDGFVNVITNNDVGIIDKSNPIYWKNRLYAFMQDSNSNICYIVKREKVTEHNFEEKEKNWVEELYIPFYVLYSSNCSKVKSIIGIKDTMYAFKERQIIKYDLNTKKIQKKNIKEYDVLGTANSKIYIQFIQNGEYASIDYNLKKISAVNTPPKHYKKLPKKPKFAF